MDFKLRVITVLAIVAGLAAVLTVFRSRGTDRLTVGTDSVRAVSQYKVTGSSGQGPSIVLITVDTLRADHLGCYGYTRDTSPNIDGLAEDGMVFEHCFGHAPETRMSMASLFTGFYPHETKITRVDYIPQSITTLAEILQSDGYRTAAVVSNYMLRSRQGFEKGECFEQGFTIYDDTMEQQKTGRNFPERTAVHTTNAAIELLEKFAGEKLFLWVHYQDPHGPYVPPEPFASQFVTSDMPVQEIKLQTESPEQPYLPFSGRGALPHYQQLGSHRDFHYYVSQYDGEIRYTDEHFRRLIDSLKQLGLYNNALIVFSADHGEGMGEHDYFFAHGEYVYAHQLHVPLIMKYGDRLRGRRQEFVQHVDLAPTILNICGLAHNFPLRGRDLLQQNSSLQAIFSEMSTQVVEDGIKFSLIKDPFHLIYTPLDEQFELFDLRADPRQESDLIENAGYRHHAQQMKLRVQQLSQEDHLPLRSPVAPAQLTDKEIQNLKTLGYLRE